MKVAIFSDIHLEFKAPFAPRLGSGVDVVVLAGDIAAGCDGIEWAKRALAHYAVVYVAGNHEFYNGHWDRTIERMRASAKGSNVHFLEDDAVTIADTRFVGCTLWTDFQLFGDANAPLSMLAARKVMPDFRIIATGDEGQPLSPEQTVARFERSRDFLKRELLPSAARRTVVVTHHLPHGRSVAKRFEDDPVSAAFASDLGGVVDEAQPDLWIHGHTHDSFAYAIGKTQVVCNPRGYPQKNGTFENLAFDPGLVIEVG